MDSRWVWFGVATAVTLVAGGLLLWANNRDDDGESDASTETPADDDGASVPDEAVRRLQRDLQELGYLDGQADGIYSPATEVAVRAFQEFSGLEADGVLGPATNAALSVALGGPTSLVFVQEALAQLCYYGGEQDGEVSARFAGAVARLQRSTGVEVDGNYGPQTAVGLRDAWSDRPSTCGSFNDGSIVDVLLEGHYVGFDQDVVCVIAGEAVAVSASNEDGATLAASLVGTESRIEITSPSGGGVNAPVEFVETDADGSYVATSGGVELFVPIEACSQR